MIVVFQNSRLRPVLDVGVLNQDGLAITGSHFMLITKMSNELLMTICSTQGYLNGPNSFKFIIIFQTNFYFDRYKIKNEVNLVTIIC